jgi:type IV fimbrial biogenesis protein FimT
MQKGLTLFELLIALAVVSILLTIAAPNLRDYVLDQRLRAAVRSLEADLLTARGHAVFSAVSTVACPADSLAGCASEPDWSRGWLIFADRNGDREWQSDEPLLRAGQGVEGVSIRTTRSRRRLRFSPSGAAPGSNATLRLCDLRGPRRSHQLRLSSSGRLRQLRPPDTAESSCS